MRNLEETLNKHLSTCVPKTSGETLVKSALASIKAAEFDLPNRLFIQDTDGKLSGFVPLITLLKSDPEATVGSLMSPCLSIEVGNTLEYAANHALSEEMESVPVTDDQNRLLGVISSKVLIETLRREHVEDIHRIAGIQEEHSKASEAITEPPFRSVWHRLPWLLAGLAGSFVSTIVMSSFENTLNAHISLAFFIPGIVYLADAIGTQTETIVIRGLSLTWTSFWGTLRREFLTGGLIGLILGLAYFPVAWMMGNDWRVSAVVSLSIIVAGTLATTIGLFLPWLIQKMGKDPAFGSGPLATIIQDILSILVYFLIATALMPTI